MTNTKLHRVHLFLQSFNPDFNWEVTPVEELSIGTFTYFQVADPNDWKANRFSLMTDGFLVLEGSLENVSRILNLEPMCLSNGALTASTFGNIFLKFALQSNQFVLEPQMSIYEHLVPNLKPAYLFPEIKFEGSNTLIVFSAIDRSPLELLNYRVIITDTNVMSYTLSPVHT